MTVVFDTSAWLALINSEGAAERVSAELRNEPVVITPIVVAELAVHAALGRTGGVDAPREAESLARFEPLTRDDAIAAAAVYARIRKRPRSKVGLADALIYATAQRIGATLVTLDTDLEDEPGVLVVSNARK